MDGGSTPEPEGIRKREVVLIGASAGGIDALEALASGLPAEFPASVLVVLHVAAGSPNVLPQILSHHGPLPASFAHDGDELRRGQIFVAPSDHHMLVRNRHIRLTRGPRENGHRPAIDPLFRSAARALGGRCIGVVASGLLDDGAAGLRFIQQHGGGTIIQDPEEARFPSMPRAALAQLVPDRIATADQMAKALCELVEEAVHAPPAPDAAALLTGPPSGLTCPECGGALWAQQETGRTWRFACHTGHAYSLASLVEEQGRSLEMVLSSAVRALEERADVQRRLARRTQTTRRTVYEGRALEAEGQAVALREMLNETGRIPASGSEDE